VSEAFLNPERWVPMSPERVFAFIESVRTRKTGAKAGGSSWNFTDAISPLDLYCYLKSRFGEPNGLMMALKLPTIDNFCHWQYMVDGAGSVLDFMGLNVRMEVRVYGRDSVNEDSWKLLEARLLGEFERSRKQLSQIRESFERWHLFVNPYAPLKRIATRNSERLQILDIKSVQVPTLPRTVGEFAKFESELKAAREKYEEAIALAASLQTLAPIMGEAAINFIMLMLAKPEIKADRRLYEDFTRRNIDVRIKSLHLCCDHFAGAVSGSEEPFKEFLRLMNRRNDTLHGNVDPGQSTGDEIYFDHSNIPLPRHYRTVAQSALANVLASVDPDASLRDVQVAHDFVEFLVSKITDELQPVVKRMLAEEQPGYRPDFKRLGVILPEHTVDLIPDRRPMETGE